MKKKLIITAFIMILVVSIFNPAISAQSLEHQFDVSIGSGTGYTEFKIGDIDTTNLNYGFKSLLEFPLDVEMLNLKYKNNISLPTLNIGSISLKLEKNLNNDAGTFTDTDWFASTGINNKDIIGTSATEVKDITRWDFKLSNEWLRAAENIQYTLHLGYKQDNYDLLSYDLEQTYLTDAYDAPAGTIIRAPGANITYQAKYDIPYIGFDIKTQYNRELDLIFSAAYSNWVKMEDEDNHLHRDLTVKGQGNGTSILINGTASYNFNSETNLFLDIGYNKTQIEGTQDQFHADGNIYQNIYYEAEQEYANISFGLNWNF